MTERCLVSGRTRRDKTCETWDDPELEEATAINIVNAAGVYTLISIIPQASVSTHPVLVDFPDLHLQLPIWTQFFRSGIDYIFVDIDRGCGDVRILKRCERGGRQS